MVGGYKICPFCGEKISSNAKKCKYCGNAFFKEKRIGSFRNFKLCPCCEAEISETAKKCKYCGEWVNEEKKFEGYEYSGKTEKKDKNYSHEIVKKGYKFCPYCGEEIRELAKKCRYCGEFLNEKSEEKDEDIVEKNKNEKSYRSWEELSSEEQKYISKKLSGWRILTAFLPTIGLIWCKRWGAFVALLVLYFLFSGLCSFGFPLGLATFLNLIFSRLIALVDFSKKAYEHDRPYFQKYLGERINMLYNENIKSEKKKNMTCGKRFGLYILYLFRDFAIYLVVSATTKGFGIWRYNTYSDAHFRFDMFVCFVIFIIKTIRLISDCSKIKKGAYGK